jgi:hypothetical protein
VRQAVLLFAFLLISFAFGLSQQMHPRHSADPPTTDPQFGKNRNGADPDLKRMEREREKRMNKDRQAIIQRDTDKLLALSTELKQYVDKTNENVLSLEVLKKAEEIEKLAHQVKEKMKTSQ